MKPWWRREIDEARESADQAERQQQFAESTAKVADAAVARAKKVGGQLRNELVQNGFADALRTAFGGVG